MSGEGILPNDGRPGFTVRVAHGILHFPEPQARDYRPGDIVCWSGRTCADYLAPLLENPDVND